MSPLCYCSTPRFFTTLHLPTFWERLCNSLEVWHKSVNSNYWQGGKFHQKTKRLSCLVSIFFVSSPPSSGLVPPGRWWSGELSYKWHTHGIFIFLLKYLYIRWYHVWERQRPYWLDDSDVLVLSMFALKLARFPGGGLWHLACLWWRSSPCTVLRSHQGTFCERRRLGDWAPIEDGYLGTQNQPPKKITVAPWPMYPLNGYRWLYNIQNTETENIWLDHLWKNTVLKTHTPKEGICGCFRVT